FCFCVLTSLSVSFQCRNLIHLFWSLLRLFCSSISISLSWSVSSKTRNMVSGVPCHAMPCDDLTVSFLNLCFLFFNAISRLFDVIHCCGTPGYCADIAAKTMNSMGPFTLSISY
ncbi:hypothetical protein ERO13_D07G035501v2, partial [Gossypium hirsutum]